MGTGTRIEVRAHTICFVGPLDARLDRQLAPLRAEALQVALAATGGAPLADEAVNGKPASGVGDAIGSKRELGGGGVGDVSGFERELGAGLGAFRGGADVAGVGVLVVLGAVNGSSGGEVSMLEEWRCIFGDVVVGVHLKI